METENEIFTQKRFFSQLAVSPKYSTLAYFMSAFADGPGGAAVVEPTVLDARARATATASEAHVVISTTRQHASKSTTVPPSDQRGAVVLTFPTSPTAASAACANPFKLAPESSSFCILVPSA
jgi:hypothetical protein